MKSSYRPTKKIIEKFKEALSTFNFLLSTFAKQNKGFSLQVVLLSTGIVMITTSMLATLLVSELRSFNRQARTQDAYTIAKEGVMVAVASLNNPGNRTEAVNNALVDNLQEQTGNGTYSIDWNPVSGILSSTGTVETSYGHLSKTISTKLINDAKTFKFNESFSDNRFNNGSTVAWNKDGQVYLTKTTIPARTTGDMYATYTDQTLSAGTTQITVNDASGFMGNLDPDEILISNTQSASSGAQETRWIASKAGNTITLTSGITGNYSGRTSITRIPQYTTVNITSTGTATINAWDNSTTTGGVLFLRSNDATTGVRIDGAIETSRLGYSANSGPGRPTGGGGGGGYGARGGHPYGGGNYGGSNYDYGGIVYGNDSEASYMGSGGSAMGGSGFGVGGTGGGLVKLVARNIYIPGAVQSNGGGGGASRSSGRAWGGGGGGSGGGITLEGYTVNIRGIISAAGGGGGVAPGVWVVIYANSGNNGNGGSGNGGSPGYGAGPTASPGRGGNGYRGFWNSIINAENGFAGSGGGGGGKFDVQSGTGGGAAGRIAIRYNNLDGGSLYGFSAPSYAATKTGPWAYYTQIGSASYGDGSDDALTVSGNVNLSTFSNKAEDIEYYNSGLNAVSSEISGNAANIRNATITIYPAKTDSQGALTNLTMTTSEGTGTIDGANTRDMSSGSGPFQRTFTWANDELGSALRYNFTLTTADVSKTPRIDHITIVYTSGDRYKVDQSTWRTD